MTRANNPAAPAAQDAPVPAAGTPRVLRRDARRNAVRILDSARAVFGESGAEAGIEQIAARAGVGVGTVYRRFASKDALLDELLRVTIEDLVTAAERALARTDGHGLEELLRAFGQSFADHAGYANLLLDRKHDPAAARRLRDAIAELTTRASAAGTIGPGAGLSDVMALIAALRGLVHGPGAESATAWARFLDLHLAGLREVRDQPPPAVSNQAGSCTDVAFRHNEQVREHHAGVTAAGPPGARR